MASGSLWNYYRDDVNYNANENDADNHSINNKIISKSKDKQVK